MAAQPNLEPAGGSENARPVTSSAAAEADHRPMHPGIDAMAVLQQAEGGKRAVRPDRRRPSAHLSAAEVIARTMARDHPDTVAAPKPPELAEAKATPVKPRKLSKAPVPVEPMEPIGGVGAEGLPPPKVDEEEVAAILNADHPDPFSFLGMHKTGVDGTLTVRAFRPDASAVKLVAADRDRFVLVLDKVHDEGLFVGEVLNRKKPFPYRLRITTAEGEFDVDDPYRFPPVLTVEDEQRLARGEHVTSYDVLGAHPAEIDGVKGTSFAVWAPNASHVSVVGDFNGWDGRRHGLRLRHGCGVWEIFLPGVGTGALYKYEIKSHPSSSPELKSDPYACAVEGAPGFASVVQDANAFPWRDRAWVQHREKRQSPGGAISVYEVHLGSWRRKPEEGNRQLTYRELADELVAYVADMGFTHIALLPVNEHTFDDTLGYLPSALYAPTGRYGTPDDFRAMVDACHRAGIGVLADWVPNFLSEEPHGLTRFDGTALYEHPDPHQGRDPDWYVPLYNLTRPQVVNYLISNALYWIDRFHLDGLNVDSLAKMLYLDYGRSDGGWSPNAEGGNDNLEALVFFRRLNELVVQRFPGALMTAEDTSLRQGITRPIDEGGLGFGLRWNSAWAYDTLRYLGRHPVHRKYYHFELTDPLAYAFDERFIFPISHDHVSIGQGSLINKMPGDRWQKFATLRAWYAMMYALPGKKLMFMGTEFAQDRQWNSDISLDWHLLEDPMHVGVQRLVQDLNRLYRGNAALHELEADAGGFEWLDYNDEDSSVISFVRYSEDRKSHVVAVTHFTPVVRANYRIGVPEGRQYKEVLNTDAEAYGGGNKGSGGNVMAEPHWAHGREHSVCLTLPPYATVVLEPAQE